MPRVRPVPPDPRRRHDALLAWSGSLGRTLAIRELRDPWAALVVEVMSQQTQIARVEERAPLFLAQFPTPEALATATTGELLRAWAGLGYNRRAVALRDAARAIVADHGGRVPSDLAALLSLPGLGPYTARAVAVRAFRLPVAPLDVNVGRVVRRVLGREGAGADRGLQEAADSLVDGADPAAWTDAVMDLAVTTCTARDPRCPACPILPWCAGGRARAAHEDGLGSARRTGAPRRIVRPQRALDAAAAGGGDGPAGPLPAGPARRDPAGAPGSSARVPFPRTRRWLRGRLVAELRAAEDGTWVRIEGDRGDHGHAAVADALAALEREGLVELHPERGARLR